MGTAQVFANMQSSGATQGAAQPWDFSELAATGLPYQDIAGRLQRLGMAEGITAGDLAKGYMSYSQQYGLPPTPENTKWWGPETRLNMIAGGVRDSGIKPTLDMTKYYDPDVETAQKNAITEHFKKIDAAKGGGGFLSELGGIAPLLAIGGLAMGFPGLLSALGGGGAAAGGLAGLDLAGLAEFAGGGLGAVGSGALGSLAGLDLGGLASFAGGGIPTGSLGGLDLEGLANFASQSAGGGEFQGFNEMMSGLGQGGLENLTPLDTNEFGTPNVAKGPIDALRNFHARNPWFMQALQTGRGALGNRDNPLLGALLGYANANMPGTAGPLSNALGMGSGVLSTLWGAQKNRRVPAAYEAGAAAADPYASLRQQAMSRLAAMDADPSGSIMRMPGYQAGIQTLLRTQGARGLLGSGNAAVEMLQHGGNLFNQERAQQMAMLGAGNPALAAQMRVQGALARDSGNQDIFNGLSTLGYGLSRMAL
jgi:hypothetical protein